MSRYFDKRLVLRVVKGEKQSVLRTPAVPVIAFDAELQQFGKQMEATMLAEGGVGLAAPQVGRSIRVLCMLDAATNSRRAVDEAKIITMVNPEIISRSPDTVLSEEGCLSLPGKYGFVPRHREVQVQWHDTAGQPHSRVFTGFAANIVQHEVDHLDGILFIDKQVRDDFRGFPF